ncbi:hypothetical protein GCK72_022329 [Caenorhabditis remanei]|uniref:Protein kinase domain-containing protein n=1 Tax=Caenorhabditis remanei TaxID=31234 RepID=A0A6A5FTI9_CAERE|nr:hypothetical protein GCK72_022329 [Caenorhabditis remanei]KAF1745882.1 hypothetical protein GCK72_022329 [Caenorhabditis remanei]
MSVRFYTSIERTTSKMNAKGVNLDKKYIQLTVGRQLAQGSYSSTFLATSNADRINNYSKVAKVAINKTPNFKYGMELKILGALQGNKYFPDLVNNEETSKYTYIVTNYAGDNLQTVAERNADGLLSNRNGVRLAHQLHNAVDHVHMIGFLHRDIQSSNVLIQLKNGKVGMKLCDFGDSTEIKEPSRRSSLFTFKFRPIFAPYHESEDHLHVVILLLKLLTKIPEVSRRKSLFSSSHVTKFKLPVMDDQHDWIKLNWVRLTACYSQTSTDFSFIPVFLDNAIVGFNKESDLEYTVVDGQLKLN